MTPQTLAASRRAPWSRIYRASRLGLAFRCPGWHRWGGDLTDRSTAAADEGTALHAMFAEALAGEPVDDPLVLQALEFARSLGWRPDGEWWAELPLGGYRSATLDLAFLVRGRLVVIDLKFGWLELDGAFATYQVLDYAQRVLRHLRMREAEAWLYAVRLDQPYRVAVRLEDARRQIAGLIRRSRASHALRAGPHCQRCPGLGLCDLTRGRALQAVGEPRVAALRALRGKPRKEAVRREVATWPAERIPPYGDLQLLESVCDAWRDRLRECLGADPGCRADVELWETGGDREGDIGALWQALRGHLTQDEFYRGCKASVSQLEKVFETVAVKAGKAPTKAAAKRMFRDLTAGVVGQERVTKLRESK